MQGVVGGVASVMMLLQLSYLSFFSWESILHAMFCHSELVHKQNFNILSTFKDFWRTWILFPVLFCHCLDILLLLRFKAP